MNKRPFASTIRTLRTATDAARIQPPARRTARLILPPILATAIGILTSPLTTAQTTSTLPSAKRTAHRLESEYAKLRKQILARYDAATPQQRRGLPDINLWPREQIMPKLAAAANLFAGTAEAVPFHLWIIRDSDLLPDTSFALRSVDRLLADHPQDERLENLAAYLPSFARSFGVTETLLRVERLRKGSSTSRVQAACMLAHALIAKSDREGLIRRLKEVIEFAPNTGSGRRAKAKLFAVEHLQVGCEAPDIVGTALDGKPFRLSDHRGKVVVLEFWAIHCGPCRTKIPRTAARLKRFANQPFAHLGIHAAGSSGQAIRKAVKTLGVTWPILVDTPAAGGSGGAIAKLWQVRGWPTVYVIDHRGIIRSNWAGEQEIRNLVPALIEKARKQ